MTWAGGSDSHGGDNGCSVYIGYDDRAGQSPSGKGSRVEAILPAAMVLSTSFRKGQGMKTPDAFMFFRPKGCPSWTHVQLTVPKMKVERLSQWLNHTLS